MKLVFVLLFCAFAFGQASTNPSESKAQNQDNEFGLGIKAQGRESGDLDILSDTRGVDFGPYLKRMVKEIRDNWYTLIPNCAQTMKGRLAIEFAILKEGGIADMRLVATSGETVLDRAAWDGIRSSNPFPALPSEFTGPSLALRLRFSYNPKDKLPSGKTCDDYPLKVVSSGKTESGIGIVISAPDGVRVPLGGSRLVSATVTGTELKENGVEWTVSGIGCSGPACGEMANDSYRAPSVMPSPPFITLTAISKAEHAAKASVTLHIVANSSR